MKRRPALTPFYSHHKSRAFWKRVNWLPEPDRTAVYVLGCVLQDVEGRVLQTIRNAEIKASEEGRG